MESKMFCFQCEQTAGGKGCMGNAGVCGKSYEVANEQDELTGALIGLAKIAIETGIPENAKRSELLQEADLLVLKGLFTTITNVNFNKNTVADLVNETKETQKKLRDSLDGCTIMNNQDLNYNMEKVWTATEDVKSLKSLILFGLRGMAAYAYHAYLLGYTDSSVLNFFYKALNAIGEPLDSSALLPLVMETGKINLACMALLDKANTETYGNPQPTQVSLKIEKGPFIVVTGHDLFDLKQLLEQTKNTGVSIYTHGEMLPAHGYPELHKYPHLKGNFGTAWQNQQKEFDAVPGAFLFTTNCLMPVKPSYDDRVFTTEVVSYPNMTHIEADAKGIKDFSPVIQKALELGGYAEDKQGTGINGGTTVTTGFGHNTILSIADKVVEGVKEGKISHFFLVGGCDGAKPGRNYFTQFVEKAPKDSIILTLACGKFRFNDLDLGTTAGIPRLLDMGQCNDAYGAIQVALALANAFNCSVNELPLSMVLSWYEQKAVCILLTLLHLGITNILLGPTLPAFISPNVLSLLVEKYNIGPTTTPEADLEKILSK